MSHSSARNWKRTSAYATLHLRLRPVDTAAAIVPFNSPQDIEPAVQQQTIASVPENCWSCRWNLRPGLLRVLSDLAGRASRAAGCRGHLICRGRFASFNCEVTPQPFPCF